MICRLYPFRIADGPTNMAIDEAMLERAARSPDVAFLRTYAWSPPTLSLGYFQKWSDADAEPRWADVAKVRRPTGGGALWHDRELTYAVVIPASHPLTRPNRALYHAVHEALAELVSDRLDARRHGDVAGPVTPHEHPFLCFADREDEDLVADGAKIVGSAQRRRAGAVLQHGALLLGRSSVTPELPGVAELSAQAVDADPAAWADRAAAALCRKLDLQPIPTPFDDDFEGRVAELARDVYRSTAWNEKR